MKIILMDLYFCIFSITTYAQSGFYKEQLRFSRVRDAVATHGEELKNRLATKGLKPDNFELFIRAFKSEKEVEIWVKNKDTLQYQLLYTFSFCVLSGQLGPKRQQRDLQVPEGLYHIDRFNPYSNFHLSLGTNYPNLSDKKRAMGNTGGNIFIHGDCVSIGCIPINQSIEVLYLLAVWAKDAGQLKIPVYIYPMHLNTQNLEVKQQHKHIKLWKELAPFYQYFEKHKQIAKFTILPDGSYHINK